ncbi:zeta toxin family protein [Fusobacterium nucleatum]|uniref:zeta toxin family protein n=2 Tax=Fusobacterium vincentii TaxID=155615 RepID=UPI0006CB583C|nr:zeta toxin family protein [Fusobacterium vincentii]ALF20234.1 ATPase [Fusobacterium vincentii ChDC F8]PIH01709.1 ATPase [Fusobacterium vincentii]
MSKDLYIFAGVNGAGKSTLYNSHIDDEGIKNSVRINTDEIVRTFGDWRNNVDQIKAGKIAITLKNKCFNEEKSFNEETTLTGKTILKTINRAKELGYKIYLYYIGVDSPEIAKERVRNRVLKGGHNISSEVIEKRYYESLENLKKIISKCDYVKIYDNSDIYRNIFSSIDNKITKNDTELPEWAKEAIREKINNISNSSVKEVKQEKNNNLKEKNDLVRKIEARRENKEQNIKKGLSRK